MYDWIFAGIILMIIGFVIWKAFTNNLAKWIGIGVALIGLVALIFGLVFLANASLLILG